MRHLSQMTAGLLALTLGALLPSAASAQEAFDPSRVYLTVGEHLLIALPGYAYGLYGHVGAIDARTADPDVGDQVPAEDFAQVRLRIQPTLTLTGADWKPFNLYQLAFDVDVLQHLAATGDGRAVLVDDDAARRDTGRVGAILGQAYFLAAGPRVAVKVGLTRSRWGLGLLANGGDEPQPDGVTSSFGYARHGDRVVRGQVAFTPLDPTPTTPAGERPLTMALAFDGVVEDDTASWADGDRAYNFIAAVRGVGARAEGGFYAVHRSQSHADGGQTTATVLDIHGRIDIIRQAELRAWIEAEAALILGQTNWTRGVSVPGSFDVVQSGGVIRLGVQYDWLTAIIEGGTASGDDNPFDGEQRAFSFDRSYRVGLLMFREVMRSTTAVGAYNVADPAYRGVAPRGATGLPTEGAVRGATYINPRVVLNPVDGLHVSLGFLRAVTRGSYADPFQSGLAGGAPVGPNGAILADDLGYELDLGVRYALNLDALRLHARVEFGYFNPGQAFDRGAADTAGREVDDVIGVFTDVGLQW